MTEEEGDGFLVTSPERPGPPIPVTQSGLSRRGMCGLSRQVEGKLSRPRAGGQGPMPPTPHCLPQQRGPPGLWAEPAPPPVVA